MARRAALGLAAAARRRARRRLDPPRPFGSGACAILIIPCPLSGSVFGSAARPIVVVDNYDSFTYNLVQQIERLAGRGVSVVRNDAFEPAALLAQRPRAIVISPGPGTPARAGRCVELIRANDAIPLLGICLGHQAIGEAFGARVVRGRLPVHGKVTEIRHRGERLFAGCPQPMQAARYHSLVVERETLPAEFVVDAESDDGAVMALSHRERPLYGLQFHPESFGTAAGDRLILNFLGGLA